MSDLEIVGARGPEPPTREAVEELFGRDRTVDIVSGFLTAGWRS